MPMLSVSDPVWLGNTENLIEGEPHDSRQDLDTSLNLSWKDWPGNFTKGGIFPCTSHQLKVKAACSPSISCLSQATKHIHTSTQLRTQADRMYVKVTNSTFLLNINGKPHKTIYREKNENSQYSFGNLVNLCFDICHVQEEQKKRMPFLYFIIYFNAVSLP